MLNIFRNNNPFTILAVIIYALLIRLSGFLYPEAGNILSSGVLSDWIYQWVPYESLGAKILAIFIVVVQAVMVNYLVNSYKIAKFNTYFPAIFYILLLSFFQETQNLSPLLMGLTFYIVAFIELFGVYRKHRSASNIFNVGFWIAIGSLFYFSIIVFFIFAIIGLLSLSNFKLGDFLILLIAFFIPYFLLGTYFFWEDGFNVFLQNQISSNLGFLDFQGFYGWAAFLKLGLAGAVALLGVLSSQQYFSRTKIQVQKYLGLFYWSLVIAGLSIFFQANIQAEHLIIICVPLSVFLALTFSNLKNKPVAEFFHLFLLVLYFGFVYREKIIELITS